MDRVEDYYERVRSRPLCPHRALRVLNPAALRTVTRGRFELAWLGVVLEVDRVYAGASRAR